MKKDEYAKIELDIVIEEYRALKNEIGSNLNAARQIVQLTFTAVAVLLGATPLIIASKLNILFLVIPLVFYALVWSQLRYIYLVLDIGNYLQAKTIPAVRHLLSELSSVKKKTELDDIMAWETPGKGPIRLRRSWLQKILFIPIAGANLGISLLASTGCVAAFYLSSNLDFRLLTSLEIILLLLNAIALLYTAYWSFQAELRR